MADPYAHYRAGEYAHQSYGQPAPVPSGYGSQGPPAAPSTSGPNYRWWIPGDGIRRDVIQADIQRYLGQDALVKPGAGTGENAHRAGFWIAGYRNLTSEMVADLRNDSTNFTNLERSGARGSYQESQVHQSRQYWGPTAETAPTAAPAVPQSTAPAYGQPTHSTQSQYQTPTPGYNNSYGPPAPSTQTPYNTAPTQQYGTAASPAAPSSSYSLYGSNSTPGSSGTASTAPSTSSHHREEQSRPRTTHTQRVDSSRYNSQQTSHQYAQASPQVQAPAGYYLASDGQYYPLAQRPT